MKHRDAILALVDDALADNAAPHGRLGPINEAEATLDALAYEHARLTIARAAISGGDLTVTIDVLPALGVARPPMRARVDLHDDPEATPATPPRAPSDGGVIGAPPSTDPTAGVRVTSALPACTCGGPNDHGLHRDGCPRGVAIADNLARLQGERGDAGAPLECNCTRGPVSVDGVLWHRDGCVFYRPDRHGPDALEGIRSSHPDAYLDLVVKPRPKPDDKPDRDEGEVDRPRPDKDRPEVPQTPPGRRPKRPPVTEAQLRDAIVACGGTHPDGFTLRDLAACLDDRHIESVRKIVQRYSGLVARMTTVTQDPTPQRTARYRYRDPRAENGPKARDTTHPRAEVEAAAMRAAGVDPDDRGREVAGTGKHNGDSLRGAPEAVRRLVADCTSRGGTIRITANGHIEVKGPKGTAQFSKTPGSTGNLTVTRRHVKRLTGLQIPGS
jgi:hypothetical protein